MMQSTWYIVLALAHAGALGGLYIAESRRWSSWPAPALLLAGALLFAAAGIYASDLQVATAAGIKETSEPFMGIYALGGAFVAFLLTVVATLALLPSTQGDRNAIQ